MYDYVIVGSGPAGSVLANRLSEKNTVLLLEAGDNNDHDQLIKNPNSNLYDHTPEYFWHGQSVPQRNLNGRAFQITGGRTAGGGSSVNGEMYVRPSPHVLKKWERIGGPQWSPDNASRNFKELERYTGTRSDVHGHTGHLHIRQTYREVPQMIADFTDALAEASGCPVIDDYNDPATPVGPFNRWQLYQKPNGDRASASVCFISKLTDRKGKGTKENKLTVLYRTTAFRVLFKGKKAVGVEYMREGKMSMAEADHVILCAGIHDVKLLMLSGIGPKKILDDAGVPVVYDNPLVGRNYAHDAYVGAMFSVDKDCMEDLAAADAAGKFAGGAFLPNPLEKKDHRAIEIIPSPAGPGLLHLSILFLDPKSRGTLRIQNNDPFKIMLADFNFLENEYDMDVLVAVLKRYIKGANDVLAKEGKFKLLAPSPDILDDDDALREYVKKTFIHTYHDQCAVIMGAEGRAVVDGYGKVYGVENLTVADASIIPYHVDGNTSAAAYLIGYTVAKHLLGEE